MQTSIPARTPGQRPLWHQLAPRYSSDRERLASYLALETAEVLAGAKPANLLSLPKQAGRSEYDFYPAWRRYGRKLLQSIGLQVKIMAERETSVLLFIYRPDALQALLKRPSVTAFLRKAGYAAPGDLKASICQLQTGISKTSFPHEMGAFLGYPLKDVAGFMGWVDLPLSGQGLWKFYGDPARSLKLAQLFRHCQQRMAQRLENCCSPFDCLRCEYFDPQSVFAPSG